jgi:hypothetical protein
MPRGTLCWHALKKVPDPLITQQVALAAQSSITASRVHFWMSCTNCCNSVVFRSEMAQKVIPESAQ